MLNDEASLIFSLSIRHHAHESRTLDGVLKHFLVLETHSGVVALHNIAEVVDERLHGGVILVVDVLRFFEAEGTLLSPRITTLLLLLPLLFAGFHSKVRSRG